MINILFYNSETMLAFEAEREIMLKIFDFGRDKEQTDKNVNEFRDLYELLLENSKPKEGDDFAIGPAFMTFAQAINAAPKEIVPSLRENITNDDFIVFGSARTFYFVTGEDARREYEHHLQFHQKIGSHCVGTA
jgi:hypothetical protein